ncbi:MAG: hypothetical protein K0R66_670 [Gammaproteobacteria bacterium]|jgi:hypothetical protein|nr:hypothetical protein [Gammaproteobacteria bacterium]
MALFKRPKKFTDQDGGLDLAALMGTQGLPAADHKNPNAKASDTFGDNSTSLTVTTAMAALKALNQQPAYAPAKAQDQLKAMMNTPTAANILGNNAQGLNCDPSPGGSSSTSIADDNN